MKRRTQILAIAAGLAALPAWAQYPPAQSQYPSQQPYPPPAQQQYPPPQQGQYPPPQQYPAQAPPPDYGQQPPYYGQQTQYPAQPPSYAPQQLDALVGRIALYPDPLLAQVLTAATFSNEVPDADAWARAHSYLNPDAMARAIQQDRLPWDPSVLALLPFPSVLDLMAGDMGWTQQLGDAVLADRNAAMDAVQRQRAVAMNYGYLQSNGQVRVVNAGPGDIEILPVDPGYMYVPYYNPYVVFARPRPGFYVGGAITFGPRIFVSTFAPWGWGHSSLGWREHRIIINNHPWERTWVNRPVYSRPPAVAHRVERHELRDYRGPAREADRSRDRDGRDRH